MLLKQRGEAQATMWYIKDLLDRAQVAFLLWRLSRHRPLIIRNH